VRSVAGVGDVCSLTNVPHSHWKHQKYTGGHCSSGGTVLAVIDAATEPVAATRYAAVALEARCKASEHSLPFSTSSRHQQVQRRHNNSCRHACADCVTVAYSVAESGRAESHQNKEC
jgi:hypothetical protein